jgi:hypothetical protein
MTKRLKKWRPFLDSDALRVLCLFPLFGLTSILPEVLASPAFVGQNNASSAVVVETLGVPTTSSVLLFAL